MNLRTNRKANTLLNTPELNNLIEKENIRQQNY